ncbi:Endoglucanase [Gryllus bimaculatus]|nr:Endoglucanase [Gryllus bimaculatus]
MKSFTFVLAFVVALAAVHANYDYGEALWKSLLFYQAQRSGKLSGMNSLVSWRKDSALHDRGQNGEDLTGGYYDAGDFVKFGFPMAYTITVLSWSTIDYADGYSKIGWLQEARNAIKWGTDYFIKAHVSKNEFYGQVGVGQEDHNYWGRPEDMTESRTAYKIDASHPGSDLAAETAAALAAASVAEKYYTDYGIQYRNGFGWLEKFLGATALLLKLTNGDLYRNVLENFCNNLVYNQKRTPKGLVYIGLWGSLRQAFDPTFICMKAADEGINPDAYRNFAKSQIDYALGNTGRSFVVGFGNNPPTHEHHRAASCPDAPAPCNYGVTYWGTQPNYHVLYGALVGGPDENDGYTDDRNNFEQNEVACDYNAAFQGVLAGLKALGY